MGGKPPSLPPSLPLQIPASAVVDLASLHNGGNDSACMYACVCTRACVRVCVCVCVCVCVVNSAGVSWHQKHAT